MNREPRGIWRAFLAILLIATTLSVLNNASAATSAPEPTNGGGGVSGTSASIDASTGAATTSVPFALPEARGPQPSLGIAYNSSARDGNVGYGWSLPTSRIERVRSPYGFYAMPTSDATVPFSFPQTKVPTPTGAPPIPSSGRLLPPSDQDRYEWNGQALVMVCYSVGIGCPATGEEVFPTSVSSAAYYRLQNDTTYARYFLFEGASVNDSHWIVQYPSGTVETYGRQPEQSGPNAAVDFDPGSGVATEQAVRWHLTRAMDTYGNGVFYTWSKNPRQSEGARAFSGPYAGRQLSYLSDIHYNSRVTATVGATAYAPEADYEFHVALFWELPDFPQSAYAPVWKATPDLRLRRVDIAAKHDTQKGPESTSYRREMVRRYHLSYYPESIDGVFVPGKTGPLFGHSFLRSVQLEGRCATRVEEMGADNVDQAAFLPEAAGCQRMPASTFFYSEPKPYTRSVQTLDFRPEGRSLPDALTPIVRPSRAAVMDVDKDGWPDVLEGYERVFRNPGTRSAIANAPRLFEDCVTSNLPPFDPSLSIQGMPWHYGFMAPARGLTVSGPWQRTETVNFFVRPNAWKGGFTEENRSNPTADWGEGSIRQVQTPCTTSDGTGRKSFRVEATFVGPLPPLPAGGSVSAQDRIYSSPDIDGDGIPDGYVRAQDSTDRSAVIRFSRQSMSYSPGYVAVMRERVRSNLDLDTTDCTTAPGAPAQSCCVAVAPGATCVPSLNVAFEGMVHSFVDMNGDGVPDMAASTALLEPDTGRSIVDVGLGYFPGNGRGHFECKAGPANTCQRSLGRGVRVSPRAGGTDLAANIDPIDRYSQWPTAPESNPRVWQDRLKTHNPILFHDVNGDGYADVVIPWLSSSYTAANQRPLDTLSFAIYINHNGKAFRRFCSEDPTGRSCDDTTDPRVYQRGAAAFSDHGVDFGDLNASGVDDLVVVDNDAVYGIDLTGGVKPGLLTSIENGLGASTSIEYTPYQRHLQDTTSNSPENGLEQVIHVVSSVSDAVSLGSTSGVGGMAPRRNRVEFRYAKPAYDPWRRQLMGFGTVTTLFQGKSARVDEYMFGPCSTARGVCPNTSDADRASAVRGRLSRSTIFATDPKVSPQHVLEQIVDLYQVEQQGVALDGRGRWHAYLRDHRKYLLDPQLPATPVTVTVPVVKFVDPETTSVVDETFTLWAPSDGVLLRTEQVVDKVGYVRQTVEHGRVLNNASLSPLDEPRTTTRTPKRIAGGSEWTWRTSEVRLSANGWADRAKRYTFDPAGGGGIAKAEAFLDGGNALFRSHADGLEVAPDPTGASQNGQWVTTYEATLTSTGRIASTRGVAVPTTKGNASSCTTFVYDDAYGHLLEQERIGLDGCGTNEVVTRRFYDRGFGVVVGALSESLLARSQTTYDAFGRPLAVYDASSTTPGLLEPTARMEWEYTDQAPFSRVRLTSRRPGASAHRDYIYVDGAGLPQLTIREDQTAEGPQLVAEGLTERDGTGLPLRSYKGFPYQGSLTAPGLSAPAGTKWMSTRYDAFGRPTATFDGAAEVGRVIYGPLQQTIFDAEDLADGPHKDTPSTYIRDGFGRPIWSLHNERTGQRQTGYFYTPSDELTWELQVHETKPETHSVYRTYDTLGRMTYQLEPNTSGGGYGQAYAYNDAGWLVGTSDSRGCGANLHYDPAGRLVARDESPCRSDQPAYTRITDMDRGVGAEVFNRYDSAESGAAPDQVGYAPAMKGRLTSVADRGAHTRFGYDVRGRAVVQSRRIAKPGPMPIDPALRYTAHWFQKTTSYDDIDRVRASSTGADVDELLVAGKSELTLAYDDRSSIASLGSSYGQLIAGTSRRIDGLATEVRYGDAAATTATLEYDDTQARTRLRKYSLGRATVPSTWTAPGYPAPDPLEPTQQGLLVGREYTYDAVGNPLKIASVQPAGALAQWPSGGKPATRTMEYDDAYRVSKVTYEYGTTLGQLADVRVSPFKNEGSSSRSVPARSLPQRVKQQTFTYDHLGNIVDSRSDNAAGSYDRHLGAQTHGTSGAGPHQLMEADGTKIHYDEAGNMVDMFVRRDGPCDSGRPCNQRFTYKWDESGHLATAMRYDFTTVGPTTPVYPTPPEGTPDWRMDYKYSGGQRVLVSATAAGGQTSHTLEVFGSLRVERTELVAGDFVRTASNESVLLGGLGRVAYLPADVPNASAGRARLFLQFGDELGSASTIIDHGTGELVERVTYDANGAVESDYRPTRWAAFREATRFTGKVDDIEVGLTYFGARYFNPNLRRWISPDPLRIHGGMADSNPYAYVHGRTMQAVDPNGLAEKAPAPAPPPTPPGPKVEGPDSSTDTTDKNGDRTVIFTGPKPNPSSSTPAPVRAPAKETIAPPDPAKLARMRAAQETLLGHTERLERAFTVDGAGTAHLPFDVTVTSRHVPAHIANVAPQMLVKAALDVVHVLPGLKQNFITDAIDAALVDQVTHMTHVDVPDAGPRDITKGVVTAGVLVVMAVATDGASAEGAAAEVAGGARAFTSPDPLVASLANKIESAYPGHVVGVNVPVYGPAGNLVTDADILLQNAVIQVKSGGGKSMTRQILNTQAATDLPVIGYGPNLRGSVVQGIERAGGLVTRDAQFLIQLVKP